MTSTQPVFFAASLVLASPSLARQDEGPLRTELSTSAVRVVESMPRAVTSFGAAACDGWLYVLGGYHGVPHEYDREGQSDAFARLRVDGGVRALEASAAKGWQELPSSGGVQSVALVAHAGRVVRVGGMVARNAPGEPSDLASIATVASFDPAKGTWSELPPLPTPRSSHMAAVLDGSLWVAGGWTLDGSARQAEWSGTLAVLDLDDTAAGWRELEAPFQRRAVGVAATRDRLVVVGGMGPEGGPSARVDLFDPASGAWSRGPDLPEGGFGVAAVGLGDEVYASAASGLVYRLRIGEDHWHRLTSLVFPRIFHQLVAAGHERLLVLGGIARGGRVAHVEAIDLAPQEGRDPITLWELDAPGRAKNRQGIFLVGNRLTVFGGNRSLGQHDFGPDDFLDEAFQLDLATHEWKEMPAFPAARQSMQTASDPDGLVGYAVGGFGHDGSAARSQAQIVTFDFEAGWWLSNAPSLPTPRSQFGLFEHGGRLWLLGGLDYHPDRPSAERFHHPTEVLAWTLEQRESGFAPTGDELPGPRRAFGAALLDGRCYLVGGMREEFELVDRCDVFDVEERSWSTIPAPRRTRISPELVALGGRLYLVGGSSEGEDGELAPDASIEVLEPGVDRAWRVLDVELPFPPKHLRAFAFGDRLLVYSAHDAAAPDGPGIVRVALLDVDRQEVEPRSVARHVLR